MENESLITSASYIFRNTGSAIGLSMASVRFQTTLRQRLDERLGDDDDAKQHLPAIREDIGAIQTLPPALRTVAEEAYIESLQRAFILLSLAGALGVVLNLPMRRHRLHSTLSRSD